MSFLETPRFPTAISLGSMGGPTYSTSIVVVRSGYESRNVNWSAARHRYDAGYGLKEIDDLEELIEFFHAVGGKAYGFRFKDHKDYKSCNTGETIANTDQTLGTGSGDSDDVDFQLVKVYTKGAFSRTRTIAKPVADTVVVSIDDISQPSGWSVDTTTGIITFDDPPGDGEVVKAGFEFDVPCRFDTDELMVSLESYQHGGAQIPIIEIRDIT